MRPNLQSMARDMQAGLDTSDTKTASVAFKSSAAQDESYTCGSQFASMTSNANLIDDESSRDGLQTVYVMSDFEQMHGDNVVIDLNGEFSTSNADMINMINDTNDIQSANSASDSVLVQDTADLAYVRTVYLTSDCSVTQDACEFSDEQTVHTTSDTGIIINDTSDLTDVQTVYSASEAGFVQDASDLTDVQTVYSASETGFIQDASDLTDVHTVYPASEQSGIPEQCDLISCYEDVIGYGEAIGQEDEIVNSTSRLVGFTADGNARVIEVQNNGQNMKYHISTDSVSILVPASLPQSAVSEGEVNADIAVIDGIATGSTVEVKTQGSSVSAKRAEKRRKDRMYVQRRRQDPFIKSVDNERKRGIMREKRKTEEFRAHERERDRIRRAEARRRDQQVREREKARDRMYQATRRAHRTMALNPDSALPVVTQEEEVISTISDDVTVLQTDYDDDVADITEACIEL